MVSRSCWTRRTTLEKALILALVILSIVVVTTFVIVTLFVRVNTNGNGCRASYSVSSGTASKESRVGQPLTSNGSEQTANSIRNKSICNSPECVQAAHRMLSFMDPKQNPCDNFHKFACGGWQAANEIKGDQLIRSVFAGEMVQRVDEALRHLLETSEDIYAMGKLKAFDIARDFYASCSLESITDVHRFEPRKVLDLLDSLGGFYDNGTTAGLSTPNITELLARLITMNGDPFFDVGIDVDSVNSSKLTIVVSLPSQSTVISKHKSKIGSLRSATTSGVVNGNIPLNIPNTNGTEEEEEFFQRLFNSRVDIDSMFLYKFMKISIDKKADDKMWAMIRQYLNRTKDDPDQEILEREIEIVLSELRDIVPFPKKLKMADETGELDSTLSIKSIQQMVPKIDWKLLLRELFGHNFSNDDQLVVIYPNYFKQLSQLIDKHGLRVMHNAALAIFARNVLQELIGDDMGPDRWQFCVEATKTAFPIILSAMYVRSFPPDLLWHVRTDISDMFDSLKVTFLKYLDKSDWLDSRSKSIAKRKVEHMRGHFVSTEALFDDKFIEKVAQNVTVNLQTFFENSINSYKRERTKMFETFDKPTDRTLFELSSLTNPFVVNAYYLHSFNTIVVTLGILFPPYYAPGEPKYVTYGSIGATVGHEIMHGFDKTGIKFDIRGNRGKWISSSSLEKFRHKSSCFQHFYHDTFHKNIPFLSRHFEINFDGNFTLNENLADNVGLEVAFQAYDHWKQLNGDEAILPGLQMTPQQLFFLSAAQSSCATMTPVAYVFALELDEHTPEPERVNGFLMNSDQFSEVFQCPVGSPMNPEKKCKLW